MNIFKKSIRRHPHLCFIQNAFEPTRPPSTALLRPPPLPHKAAPRGLRKVKPIVKASRREGGRGLAGPWAVANSLWIWGTFGILEEGVGVRGRWGKS